MQKQSWRPWQIARIRLRLRQSRLPPRAAVLDRFIEQCSDGKVVKEQVYSALQLYCFLLFFYFNSMVHGRPRKNSNSETLAWAIAETLAEELPVNIDYLRLTKYDIAPCNGCGGTEKTGICVIKDELGVVATVIGVDNRLDDAIGHPGADDG